MSATAHCQYAFASASVGLVLFESVSNSSRAPRDHLEESIGGKPVLRPSVGTWLTSLTILSNNLELRTHP